MCSLFVGPSKIPAADQQAGPVLTFDKDRTDKASRVGTIRSIRLPVSGIMENK